MYNLQTILIQKIKNWELNWTDLRTEFELSYVEIFSVIVLTLCKVQFEENRKRTVDSNSKVKWHKIRERWDLSEPALISPLEPFNHWKLSGHVNTCSNRLNSMWRAITFINLVGRHPRKSLQAQIDEYLRCNVMLYSLTYVICKWIGSHWYQWWLEKQYNT